jgi:hypothetical protein
LFAADVRLDRQAGRDVQSVELIAAVDRAAELQAISEHLRADALRGRAVFDDLGRLLPLVIRVLIIIFGIFGFRYFYPTCIYIPTPRPGQPAWRSGHPP